MVRGIDQQVRRVQGLGSFRFVLDLNVRDIDLKKNPSHVDLSKPLTNDKHVQIRFEVIKTAMELEMWNEAYKILETIKVLKTMRKGAFR
jgi:translation initiation factor 3 subunit A